MKRRLLSFPIPWLLKKQGKGSSAFHRLWFLFLLLAGSCGYRWEGSPPPSLSIAPIPGDSDGSLLIAIASSIATSHVASIVFPQQSSFHLEVTIQEHSSEPIGYRWNRQKINGEIKKEIIASETRRQEKLLCTLFQNPGREKIASFTIEESAEFDFVDQDSLSDLSFINKEGIRTTVLPFSLGQLEPFESAQEAVERPLYQRLAQSLSKILSIELQKREDPGKRGVDIPRGIQKLGDVKETDLESGAKKALGEPILESRAV